MGLHLGVLCSLLRVGVPKPLRIRFSPHPLKCHTRRLKLLVRLHSPQHFNIDSIYTNYSDHGIRKYGAARCINLMAATSLARTDHHAYVRSHDVCGHCKDDIMAVSFAQICANAGFLVDKQRALRTFSSCFHFFGLWPSWVPRSTGRRAPTPTPKLASSSGRSM